MPKYTRIKKLPVTILLLTIVAAIGYLVLPLFKIEVDDYITEEYTDFEYKKIYPIVTQSIEPLLPENIFYNEEEIFLFNRYHFFIPAKIVLENISDETVSFKASILVNIAEYGTKKGKAEKVTLQPGENYTVQQKIHLLSKRINPLKIDKSKLFFNNNEAFSEIEITQLNKEKATKKHQVTKCRYRKHKRSCYKFLASCKDKKLTNLSDNCDKTLVLKSSGYLPRKAIINTKESGLNLRLNPINNMASFKRDTPIFEIPSKAEITVIDFDPHIAHINQKSGYWAYITYQDPKGHIHSGYVFGNNIKLKE